MKTSVWAVTALAVTLISVEQEVEIGRQAQAQVRKETPELGGEVQGYVAGVGRALAQRAAGPRYPYSFSIANYREINAFALPGGPVWVHRGALGAAGNEAQLAGVLAHEIAHIAERHAAGQITKALVAEGLLALLGAALGSDGGSRVAQAAGRIFAGGYMLKFSRDDEREADRVGADIMRRAGWDPTGMIEFLDIIRSQQGRDPSQVEVFLSSHPSPASRVAELRRTIRRGGRRNSPQFQQMQSALRRLPPAQRMPRK
jgi:predicted Zn-dependent protease